MEFFNILDCLIGPNNNVQVYEWLQWLWGAIRVATPIIVVILISLDFVKAVISSKEDDMKKAQSDAIKRIIIGIVIFFIPTLVNLILNLADGFSGTCGIGW